MPNVGPTRGRINIYLDPRNKEYLKLLAKATGQTIGSVTNTIITQHREDNAAAVDKLTESLAFLETLTDGQKPKGPKDPAGDNPGMEEGD